MLLQRGWTRATWDALPDAEQFDLLAYDRRRRDEINGLMAKLGESLSAEVYATLARELV